jgi:cytochrome c-type biogenesis protein CcmE
METVAPARRQPASAGRAKFIIGGVLIIAAIVYLIISSTQANSEFFLTINEVMSRKSELVASSRDVRVSGAVIGDTIKYDPQTLTLTFTVANIPNDNKLIDTQGGLAAVLHAAVVDKNVEHLAVVYKGVKPDLLKDEAQAIMTGRVGADGVFTANELLLKCPTKYQEAVPAQASSK